ncbi:hypothetical protein VB735_20900 [Halotia wernerae UHCC 0503]|nr:hypothetical protein [Halotia wernerae UHCC 0503]
MSQTESNNSPEGSLHLSYAADFGSGTAYFSQSVLRQQQCRILNSPKGLTVSALLDSKKPRSLDEALFAFKFSAAVFENLMLLRSLSVTFLSPATFKKFNSPTLGKAARIQF